MYPLFNTEQGWVRVFTFRLESVKWVMKVNARAHNLLLNTLGVMGLFCGAVRNVSPSDQVLVGVAHVQVPLSMPTYNLKFFIFVYLKNPFILINSILSFSKTDPLPRLLIPFLSLK